MSKHEDVILEENDGDYERGDVFLKGINCWFLVGMAKKMRNFFSPS